jgi:pimeloyl-ACP methyl ester carboxylesterase
MSFALSHGLPIYYERHGKGPAVVFCHGAGSNAATWWQQVPVFARRHTCITLDNRCFGRSAVGLPAFEPHLFVDDLVAVLNAEGIERAVLVCQSLGGMTGLRCVLQHPARVSAFVACDSPLAIDHPAMLANVKRFLAAVEATELEDRALSRSFVAQKPELAFLYGQINRFNPAVHSPQHALGWGARLASLFDPGYVLPTASLRELNCPTLFIVGEEDPVVTPEVVHELAQYVRRSRVVTITGAGHSPYFEQALEFNRVVMDFLGRT